MATIHPHVRSKPDMPGPTTEEHKMGTSIMACVFDGGVVLGADSRTTTGSYIANRVSDKINSITDNIYVCRSGSAADTQTVRDYVRQFADQMGITQEKEPSVKAIASLFRLMCYNNKDLLSAGIICAGYDIDKKCGEIYSIPLGGAIIKQPFSIGGSGSTYIYGWCDAHYQDGMTKEEAQNFVKHALAMAMARDGSSGGVIRLVTLDKDGVDRLYISGDNLPRTPWQG